MQHAVADPDQLIARRPRLQAHVDARLAHRCKSREPALRVAGDPRRRLTNYAAQHGLARRRARRGQPARRTLGGAGALRRRGRGGRDRPARGGRQTRARRSLPAPGAVRARGGTRGDRGPDRRTESSPATRRGSATRTTGGEFAGAVDPRCRRTRAGHAAAAPRHPGRADAGLGHAARRTHPGRRRSRRCCATADFLALGSRLPGRARRAAARSEPSGLGHARRPARTAAAMHSVVTDQLGSRPCRTCSRRRDLPRQEQDAVLHRRRGYSSPGRSSSRRSASAAPVPVLERPGPRRDRDQRPCSSCSPRRWPS